MAIRALHEAGEGDEASLRLDDYLPYRLSVASSAVSRLIARAYEDRFGLTIAQWRVFCILVQDGPRPCAALAAQAGMEAEVIDGAVRAMIRRGLAEMAPDGPESPVRLTSDGARLYEQIAPLALAYEAALISGLAPQEVALLKRLLSRLQGAASVLAGERPA